MQVATFVIGLLAYTWLLVTVQRQEIRKQLPWFVLYATWESSATLVQLTLWLTRRTLYYNIYWWMEAVEIALIVAAVRESFLRIFQGFTRKLGFRRAVWSVIVAVVVYSAWKSIHAPPLQSSHLDAFVYGAEFLFRWGVAGIALLTSLFSLPLKEGITREDAVVVGFGAASITVILYVSSFSLFGAKYIFLTKYVASVGYFLTAFWWIYVFSRPVRQFGFEELGMGPEEIRKALRRYRTFGERL